VIFNDPSSVIKDKSYRACGDPYIQSSQLSPLGMLDIKSGAVVRADMFVRDVKSAQSDTVVPRLA